MYGLAYGAGSTTLMEHTARMGHILVCGWKCDIHCGRNIFYPRSQNSVYPLYLALVCFNRNPVSCSNNPWLRVLGASHNLSRISGSSDSLFNVHFTHINLFHLHDNVE